MAEQEKEPLSEVTGQLILIQLMRIYDVQMSLLSEANDEHAEHLQKTHEAGRLITQFPWIDV